MKTTKSTILSALSDGQPWTMAALVKIAESDKQSVSKRIHDLRKDGHDISSTDEWKHGKLFRSTYQLGKLQTTYPISA